MIIGGLSEKDVDIITALLEEEGVQFSVNLDGSVLRANKFSMHNDIRHLASPNISTDILAVEIHSELEELSAKLKAALAPFGVCEEFPSGGQYI